MAKVLGVIVEENPALALMKISEFNDRVIAHYKILLEAERYDEATEFLDKFFGKYPEEDTE